MKHIIVQADDIPYLPSVMDRRKGPDRRTAWRGGRRDSDWLNRPPGAWAQIATRRRPPTRLARVMSVLNLW
ncbi:MAG TPA: hypothetical protein VLD67_11875 [Vicinamibacterales bacterium]|nr:hypothetical protein [Vicinamibacterales bacterium]